MKRREQIIAKWDGMTPRERDAWVAEVVFGFEVHGRYYVKNGLRLLIPYFTDDISEAWAVVDMSENWGGMDIGCYGKGGGKWYNVVTYANGNDRVEVMSMTTAQGAICLAALIARLTED